MITQFQQYNQPPSANKNVSENSERRWLSLSKPAPRPDNVSAGSTRRLHRRRNFQIDTKRKTLLNFIALFFLLPGIVFGASGNPLSASAAPAAHFDFTVDTFADGNDLLHGDGLCAMSNGECSLRAAFEEIGVWPLPTTATVTFSVSGTVIGAIGNVSADVTIIGPAGGITLTGDLDGNGTGDIPILSVQPGGVVRLYDLTITKAPTAITNNGTLTVDNVVFNGNVTGAIWGGALYNETGLAVISNSTFIGNQAAAGGAIRNGSATLNLTNSAFSGNIASAGGALYNYRGAVTIANSTFYNNQSMEGGAIYNEGLATISGSITMSNSTISGNSVTQRGGGVYQGAGVLDFSHVTITGNSAGLEGGGGYRYGGGSFTLRSSIVANSAGGDCAGIFPSNGGGNLVEDGSCGFAASGDPALGILQDNGGATLTHALGIDSPAIDSGNPATCLSEDQRGQARDDLNCDSGAYELRFGDNAVVSKAISGTGDYTFGGTLVSMTVNDTGGCLTGVTVQRQDEHHPNATLPLQTGHWWLITPTGCASGFDANLTLPADFTLDAQDKVCFHVSGSTWNCAAASFTSDRITRNNVTEFSEWAVGDNAGPTAVELRLLRAATPRSPLVWGITLAGVACAVGCASILAQRLKRQRSSARISRR